MLSFPKMKNPIGSLVIEILSYRKKHEYIILSDSPDPVMCPAP